MKPQYVILAGIILINKAQHHPLFARLNNALDSAFDLKKNNLISRYLTYLYSDRPSRDSKRKKKQSIMSMKKVVKNNEFLRLSMYLLQR